MNIHDFRRLALSLPGAEESSHMGSPDFRVGGRIFATLAAAKLGYGNIMITPEQQAAFVAELPEIFIPVAGGWGRGGATHVNLAVASEDVVLGALQTAHKLRLDKNAKAGSKPPSAKPKSKPKPMRTPKKKKSPPTRSKRHR
jgi:YjbR protein